MDKLVGELTGIKYKSPKDWIVGELKTDEGYVNICGVISSPTPGEILVLSGRWKNHPKFGRQFDFKSYTVELPIHAAGKVRYLANFFPDIGMHKSRLLVETYGDDLFEILDNDPMRLVEVSGISERIAQGLAERWGEEKKLSKVKELLSRLGLTIHQIGVTIREYGDKAYDKIVKNPYALTEIHGFGFKICDGFARALGVPKDHPFRIEAGILHVLDEASHEGHVYLPRAEMLKRATKLLEISLLETQLDTAITILGDTARLSPETVGLYLPYLHEAERVLAYRTACLLEDGARAISVDQSVAGDLTRDLGLNDKQEQALGLALSDHPIFVVTGGPGTGKTYLQKALCDYYESIGLVIELCAPTGKAAKRLSEATNRTAATIHRLLEYHPELGWRINSENPLECDVLIVDEASMIDVTLAARLFDALVPGSVRVVIVGDVDQLPSVGAGRFLDDMIQCPEIPVVRLTDIMRQAANSGIVVNAHRINQGVKLEISNKKEGQDFFFFECPEPANILGLLKTLPKRVRNEFGFQNKDIQILAPQKRGDLGVWNLNRVMGPILNPNRIENDTRKFVLGDRVMQLRNDYSLQTIAGDPCPVFNGYIGHVVKRNPESSSGAHSNLAFEFDGRKVELDKFEDRQLAFASTIHKSQGSEFEVVIMVLHTQHYMMLRRNLLYTALTRAKRLAIVVGTSKAANIAIKNNPDILRFSDLPSLVKSYESFVSRDECPF